jgi:high-affinity K+ transport system ATPase subunit B
MNQTGSSRLMVVNDGQLAGVIALKDMMKFLSLKVELDESDRPQA